MKELGIQHLHDFIQRLENDPRLGPQIVHHEFLPPLAPRYGPCEPVLDPELQRLLRDSGIHKLYEHQAEALARIERGENVAVATPTASGKTLIYTLPVLQALLQNDRVRALYLFPLKALEQDQHQVIETWIHRLGARHHLRAAVYDGDTPPHRRKKIRETPPQILITNPDMLHLSLLAYHDQWRDFFGDLRFVVVDELHTYKGVLGSHIVQVFRRLRRICRHYGSAPRFVALSATVSNPGEFAERLTGVPYSVIDKSGAPRAGRHILFVNPLESPYTLATRLLRDTLEAGFKTIAFTQARKITELIYTWLMEERPQLGRRVSSYRAGFLPEERREIERRLLSGEMDGVVSTSALEMGIDIGGLDICLLVGYPGTIINTWQRGGRVGRGDRESLIALIAQPDALDQYFMRHPQRFFESRFEKAIVDPSNRKVLKAHLTCAAAELPLQSCGDMFDMTGDLAPLAREMERERLLLRSGVGEQWFTPRRRPHREVDIRAAGEAFTIIDDQTGKVVGKTAGHRTFSECHAGAVYLHRGEHFLVSRLDLKRRDVYVRRVRVPFYTRARTEKDTEILTQQRSRPVGNCLVRRGRLRVTERIVGYEKRRISGQDLLSTHPLDLPPIVFETVGMWIEIEDFVREGVVLNGRHFMGGIHATEHALIALFPLFALCDRNDVGGISIPLHPQLGKAAVFVYDGYPEGVGLAERAFEIVEELLEAALTTLEACDCEEGCPACIHSPKCGSGNKPLDKTAAALILKLLLGRISPLQLGVHVEAEEDWEHDAPVPESRPSPQAVSPRVLYFDLETQKTAQEVGGWQNKHLMRLSVAVVYDQRNNCYRRYFEHEVEALIRILKEADLVVGFNIRRFDWPVLSAYTGEDLNRIPTFDLLEDIHSGLGFRLSLDHLATQTLGEAKTADGLQAVSWFREGNFDDLAMYCRKDVELTQRLFEFGCRNTFLLYETREGHVVRLPVDWNLDLIMQKVREAS
jgi:DEAD/DEAH box helicase domain-containing protein